MILKDCSIFVFRVKQSKLKELLFFYTSVNNHPVTWCHMPEDLNLQLPRLLGPEDRLKYL